jgi:HEAT repeat protein
VKRDRVSLEDLLAGSSSTQRIVLEAQFRAFGLDPRRSPTLDELLRKDRKRSPLSAYPVTTGLMIHLLEVSPADLVDDESHRAPKDIAARALVRAFTHERKELREMAISAARMNISLKPAEKELRRLLGDPRPGVRRTAAAHLEWQESPQVSAFFEHIDLELADPSIRRLGFNDLKHVVTALFVRLRRMFDGKSTELTRTALGILWKTGDELNQCGDAIMKSGTHKSAEIRQWAVTALKPMLRPHSSIDHLLLCRAFDRSTKTRTREDALLVLEKQGRPLDYWREWLVTRATAGPARDRAQAVRLLAMVKHNRKGIEACLLRATRDRHPSVREAAAATLSRPNLSPEGMKRMEELLDDRFDNVAVAAAGALIPINVTRKVRHVLGRGLRSRDVECRLAVLLQIQRLGNEGGFAFNGVRRCLSHYDVNVVNWSIDALKSMGRVDIPQIRELAKRDNHIVSRYARWVLKKET